ncbi:MAG: DUF5683 domain-containing protein [Candidatus Omnitrophota bacterium]
MECSRCNFANLEESSFCTQCGLKFSRTRPAVKKQKPYPAPPKPLAALILSLLLPGLGQIYNKEYKKGAVFFLSLLLFGGAAVYSIGTSTHFITMMIFSFGEAYMLNDAYLKACQKTGVVVDNNLRKKASRHVLIAMAGIAIFFIFIFYNIFGTHRMRFDIPGLNLSRNDSVLIKKRYYLNKHPEAGDLVMINSRLAEVINPKSENIKLRIIDDSYSSRQRERILQESEISLFNEKIGSLNKAIYIYAPFNRRKKL